MNLRTGTVEDFKFKYPKEWSEIFGTCVYNIGAELGRPLDIPRYSDETQFPVTKGRRYTIYGMGMFNGNTSVLVRPDGGQPDWLEIALFEILDQQLPPGWMLSVRDSQAASGIARPNGWTMMLGYPELILDPTHSDDPYYDPNTASFKRANSDYAPDRGVIGICSKILPIHANICGQSTGYYTDTLGSWGCGLAYPATQAIGTASSEFATVLSTAQPSVWLVGNPPNQRQSRPDPQP